MPCVTQDQPEMGLESAYAAQAEQLVLRLAERCRRKQPIGYMSVSVYDTAWVAMVRRPDGSWLLPESFQYLLDMQSATGFWKNGSAKDHVDGISNTLAGLLCLIKHRTAGTADLDKRIGLAKDWLSLELQSWNVDETDHVAFEILIPSLLGLLHEEGIDFTFPGADRLQELHDIKVGLIKLKHVYADRPSTLLHSLEAFAGQLDFDRVTHHLVKGSLMNSPSSTAAYLIYASSWNDEAEEYLRSVVTHGTGAGSGGVPSAFPSTFFDLSWVLSTLLETGLEDSEDVRAIADHLELKDGVVGFATGIMPDSDDTAKTILALSLAGRSPRADAMVKTFYHGGHFKTYPGERNPSFSANCNALMAILNLPDLLPHSDLIGSVLRFLCKSWFDGFSRDKWNIAGQYSLMLLSRVLVQALYRCADAGLTLPSEVSEQLPVILAQIVCRTLRAQLPDGSFGPCEVTAYGVLTLQAFDGVPCFQDLQAELRSCIQAAQRFLEANRDSWTAGSYVWVEKTTYASFILSETYCIAAMCKAAPKSWNGKHADLIVVPPQAAKLRQFFARLPLFAALPNPDRHLRAAFLVGYAMLPLVQRGRHDIFARAGMAEDRYLEYIPLIWAACDMHGPALPANTLLEMMRVSMFNYQIDEFMETAVAGHAGEVRAMIPRVCQEVAEWGEPVVTNGHGPGHDHGNGHGHGHGHGHGNGNGPSGTKRKRALAETNGVSNGVDADAASGEEPRRKGRGGDAATLEGLEATLRAYVQRILEAPAAQRSPASVRDRLRGELAEFLLAHVTQLEDSAVMHATTPSSSPPSAPSSAGAYFDWAHGTAALHTSCPFSFTYFSCLLAAPGRACFPGVRAPYVANELRRHLATMCRQYNDYGSIARDRAEHNLNSVDFPEFGTDAALAKADLFWIAEYEREGLVRARKTLRAEVPATLADAWDVFIDVTDVFGQIYVARDIASRVK